MASAWFDLKYFDQSPIRRKNENKIKRLNSLDEVNKNGLLHNIDPSLSLNEIKQLIDDCYKLTSLNLYPGLKISEAFYVVSEQDNLQFLNSLELFGDRIQLRELDQKAIYYKVNVPLERKSAFFKRMKQIAGTDTYADSYLICCDYQKKLIENYLTSQGSEFINGFDSILVRTDFDRKKIDDDQQEMDNFDKELDQAQGYDENLNHLPIEDLDEENFNENYSNLNLIQQKTFKAAFETFPSVRYEFHHKLHDQLELILTESDLTNLNSDCLVNFFKINSYNSVQNTIKLKAGSDFDFQLNKFTNSYIRNQKNNILMTDSGHLTKFKTILTYLYTNDNHHLNDNIQASYFKLYDIYTTILKKSIEAKMSSLALTFISLNDDDFDIGLLALIESLNDFVKLIFHNRKDIVKVYIASFDRDSLKQLENYLKNGYDKSFLNSLIDLETSFLVNKEIDINNNQVKKLSNNNDVEPKTVNNRNFASNYFTDEKEPKEACNSCGSFKSIINFTNIANYDFFKKCKQSFYQTRKKDNIKNFKCNICLIINQLVLIDFEMKKFKSMCFKCIKKIFIDYVKSNFCSCCLRESSRNDANINKFCSIHSVCAKCFSLPSSLQANYCYFCNFVRFGNELSNITSKDLTENHFNMGCSKNFCDLKYAQLSNKPVDKLSCGHLTCCLNKLNNDNKCNLCSIFKLFDLIITKNKMGINKLIDFESLELDEDENELITEDEDEIEKCEVEHKENINQTKLTFQNSQNDQIIEGGNLQCKVLNESLPGFEEDSTLALSFFVPNGIQKQCHPQPKHKYNGTCKTIFLPNNQLGKRSYELIVKLFEDGKLFKLDKSKANENEYIVVFNDIKFKTSKTGGVANNGYPDEGYLDELNNQLFSMIREPQIF